MARSKKQSDAADATGSPASTDSGEPLSFESALDRLEQTVTRLEEGDLPLEEALVLFESGVRLSQRCHETLGAAERRIEILVAERDAADGGLATERFADDDGADLVEDD